MNGESTSTVWPTLGSRTAKEQNRTEQNNPNNQITTLNSNHNPTANHGGKCLVTEAVKDTEMPTGRVTTTAAAAAAAEKVGLACNYVDGRFPRRFTVVAGGWAASDRFPAVPRLSPARAPCPRPLRRAPCRGPPAKARR